jgi:polysaccharide biosynthesis/export protein
MIMGFSSKPTALLLFFVPCALCLLVAGCHSTPAMDAPTEPEKVIHPDYTISPPDVLLIDAANLIPKPPYRIAPLDGLLIRVTVLDAKQDQKINELVKNQPIDGLYRVEVTGEVNLGYDYLSVALGGKTIPEATKAIEDHLKKRFKADFNVLVALVESRALQQIRGEHLVRQDGKVTLGIYGSVFVTGLTVEKAKLAIETHLTEFLFEPAISVDVIGYNSKVYYVVVDLGDAGKQLTRFPITGNESVMDALSQIKGLPAGTSSKRIWVARQSPIQHDEPQVMPVDWDAIVRGRSMATNYQLLPGDRVFVSVDPLVRLDQYLAKVLSPVERIFGIVLLGNSTVQTFSQTSGGTNGTTGR